MSKHTTAPRTLSRRLVALLAALALLAAMALPVYAEALDGATGTAQAEIGDTISDGTVTTENGSTTPVVEEKTEDENSESNGDSLPGQEQDQNEAETDESETQDGATDIIESPAQDDTDAEDQTKDETAEVSNEIATQAAAEDFTVYFAAPAAWGTPKQVTFIGKKGSDGTGDQAGNLEKDMSLTNYVTSDGRLVYKVELHYQEPSDNSNVDIIKGIECPFNGYVWMKVKGDQQEVSLSNTWTNKDDFKGKCYIDGVWQNISELKQTIPHQRLAGKTMYFKNATDAALENVQVVFYEKTNDQYVEVGRQQLNTVGKNDVASFTIPAAACAYVQILVNGQTVGIEYYNFYNDDTALAENAKFTYDSATNCCFTYSSENQATWGARSGVRIYFDATYSAYEYTGDSVSKKKGMPTADTSSDHRVHCRFYDASGNATSETLTMTQIKDASASSRSLWYIDIPENETYINVRFSAWSTIEGTGTAQYAELTDVLTIPYNLTNPCFFADNGDDVTYNSSNANRDGYWGEMDSVRDAGNGKTGKAPVVDIAKDTFKQESGTKYVNSTLYDYYTDWELNGNNRDDYKHDFDENNNERFKKFSTNRNWAPFRQFDFAVSDYYATAGEFNTANAVLFPIYTGHFQPGEYKWESFADLKRNDKIGLDLFGFTKGRAFMAANNSVLCAAEDGRKDYYDYTFQGIVADKEVNGLPIMRGTKDGIKLVEPHFNADFLKGNNSQKAKLGDVYENVSFPFTQADVFGEKVKYWAFDAADTTLYLKQDSSDNSYFLQKSESRTASQNRNADSTVKQEEDKNDNNKQKPTYGFFPFNETIPNDAQASNYNYGFGAKLQFNFTLTENGKVKSNDGSEEVPIKFFFSGDDDVWVFIDGRLVLDVGGAHGKASGLLEFGANGDKNTVTPYVSSVKQGGTSDSSKGKNPNTTPVKTITYKGSGNKNEQIDFYYAYAGDPIEYAKGGTHTLTMYYMERGMWESNMAVAFNFPDNNELEVEKKVNVDDVDELFKSFFDNVDSFGFTIKNLATHYGLKSASTLEDTKTLDVTQNTWNAKPANPADKNVCAWEKPTPGGTSTEAIHWYADMKDEGSTNREKRYGEITPNSGQADIREMSYLSFEVYANTSDDTYLNLNDLYLELVDNSGKQRGSPGTAGLAGKTYNSVSKLKANDWVTIKLDLTKLVGDQDFNTTQLKTIRIGDNFPVNLYIRNIQFTSKAAASALVGFTTAQKDIPDYGTALDNTNNEMKPAEGAQYTSSLGGSTQVVDKDGHFQLKNKETVTFKDQFRRGSYISVTEDADPDLYETTWTIYENGQAVTSNGGGKTVGAGTFPLSNVKGNAPDDDRTEKTTEDIPLTDDDSQNSYNGKKPEGKAIVFRSYTNPDAGEAAELTKLKLQFVNKVKTGSITIKKLGDETVNGGTFKFKVTYTNVGGQNLEGNAKINETYPVDFGDDHALTINGIPIGTQFTIEEVPDSDTHLLSVAVEKGDTAQVVDGKTVKGTVTKTNSSSVTATFTNTMHDLMDIDLAKSWKNADGEPMTNDELKKMPDTIYVKLQRRVKDGTTTDWKDVAYPSDSKLGYVEVERSYTGWERKLANLDATAWNSEGRPAYEYRVVEGTLVNDEFKPVDSNSMLVIGDNVYQVSSNTADKDNKTITLTNTRLNPKFDLDILKKSADEPNKFLEGVEFKLEKLTTDGKDVDNDFKAQIGVTNAAGKPMLKEGGTITEKPAFTGLEPGKYRLTETKAAKDYNLLSAPIEVEFTKTGECWLNDSKIEVWTEENHTDFIKNGNDRYTLKLTVLNRKTPTLPHTGADAPSLWLLIGLPLAVAGLLILVFRYNKKGGRQR